MCTKELGITLLLSELKQYYAKIAEMMLIVQHQSFNLLVFITFVVGYVQVI